MLTRLLTRAPEIDRPAAAGVWADGRTEALVFRLPRVVLSGPPSCAQVPGLRCSFLSQAGRQRAALFHVHRPGKLNPPISAGRASLLPPLAVDYDPLVVARENPGLELQLCVRAGFSLGTAG